MLINIKDLDKIDVICYFADMRASFRMNDFILVIVVVSSMMIAIIFPDFGARFQVFPFYSLMINFS